MKVFVTGATGFVGGAIVSRLEEQGHSVRALVRPNSAHGTSHLPDSVETAEGGVLDPALAKHLAGVEAVIHLVGVIREFPARGVTFQKLHVEAAINVIRAMRAEGVSRLVHMSALGAGPGAATAYFRSKWEAERAVMSSGLGWTVIKPSVIFGPRDEFVNMLAGQVRMLPVVPVMGDGSYRLQPVSVRDVAAGFVASLEKSETIGRTFEVGGPEQITYNDMLDQIARALGKQKARKLHLPLGPMRIVVRLLEGFDFFPVTSGQLAMLLMNNVCDEKPYCRTFGLDPVRFGEGIREYVGT